MCISARASLVSFLVNLVSCVALVKYGNSNLKFYNVTIASWLIYVSLMQFVDYGIWIDLDCKTGMNKLATVIGPILNHTQPLALFGIAYFLLNYTKLGREFYNSHLKSQENGLFKHFNIAKGGFNFIKIMNIAYALFLVIALAQYYTLGTSSNPELLCSRVCSYNSSLSWPWNNKNLLLILFTVLWHIFIINSISINPESNYIKFTVALIYILLFLSFYLKNKNAGEFWCYIVNFGGLVLLIVQKLFSKYFN